MITYLVYLPKTARGGSQQARFIADHFAWLGFAFPAFWLLFQRQWLAGIAVFALQAGLTYASSLSGAAIAGLLAELALRLLVGLEGPAFIARRLEARGFTLAAVLPAPDLATAEAMYGAGLEAETSLLPAPLPRLEPGGSGGAIPHPDPGFGLFDSYGSR